MKKTITRDKEGHYKIIKGSIQEEDIAIIIIYAPKTGAPQHIMQMLTTIKGEIDNNMIIVGEFNIPPYQWIDNPDRNLKRKNKL